MTNEEIVAYGKDYYRDLTTACCEIDKKHKEFVRMAIKALSQEPTKREIEREYLFQSLCEDFKKLQAENDDLRKRLEQEPCDDAISREELLKAIDTWDKFGYTETGCFVRITKEIDNYVPYVHLEDVITAIQKLPPVTQKSGKWIKSRDCYGNYHFTCSKCGNDIATKYADNWEDKYCSECGAKMENNNNE